MSSSSSHMSTPRNTPRNSLEAAQGDSAPPPQAQLPMPTLAVPPSTSPTSPAPSDAPFVLIDSRTVRDMQDAIASLSQSIKVNRAELGTIKKDHRDEIQFRNTERREMMARIKDLESGRGELATKVKKLENGKDELTTKIKRLENIKAELVIKVKNLEDGRDESVIKIEERDITIACLQQAVSDLLVHAEIVRGFLEAKPQCSEALDRLHLRAALDMVETAIAKLLKLDPATTYKWRALLLSAEMEGLTPALFALLTLTERNQRRLAKGKELLNQPKTKNNPIIKAIFNNAAAMRIITQKDSIIRASGNVIAHHLPSGSELMEIISGPNTFLSLDNVSGLKFLFQKFDKTISDSVVSIASVAVTASQAGVK